MKKFLLIACVAASLPQYAATMASQPWVTNRIAEAEARIVAQIPSADLTPATNYTDALEARITSGQVVADRARVAQEAESAHEAGRADTASTASSAETATRAESAAEADSAQYADSAYNLATTESGGEDYRTASTIFQQLDNAATKSALAAVSNEAALVHLLYTASNQLPFSVSTNNPAFVSAVTNCPVAIAASDAEALTEWGIYGGGGTIGALLAALAAAVVALRKKKMPLYPVGGTGNPINATYASGVLTVSPFSMAAYAPTASAAFSVAMGALPSDMESGKARDAVLVIDCSSLTDGQEPRVTWGSHFHPRTNAATDLAIVEAGKRAVFYISEYAAGEFAVGGWTETAGGNAQSGGSGT